MDSSKTLLAKETSSPKRAMTDLEKDVAVVRALMATKGFGLVVNELSTEDGCEYEVIVSDDCGQVVKLVGDARVLAMSLVYLEPCCADKAASRALVKGMGCLPLSYFIKEGAIFQGSVEKVGKWGVRKWSVSKSLIPEVKEEVYFRADYEGVMYVERMGALQTFLDSAPYQRALMNLAKSFIESPRIRVQTLSGFLPDADDLFLETDWESSFMDFADIKSPREKNYFRRVMHALARLLRRMTKTPELAILGVEMTEIETGQDAVLEFSC